MGSRTRLSAYVREEDRVTGPSHASLFKHLEQYSGFERKVVPQTLHSVNDATMIELASRLFAAIAFIFRTTSAGAADNANTITHAKTMESPIIADASGIKPGARREMKYEEKKYKKNRYKISLIMNCLWFIEASVKIKRIILVHVNVSTEARFAR